MSFKIIGTGSGLPDLVVTNDDLSKFVDTSDEWITSRTGIRQRHILQKETLLDIAVKAAMKALENARVNADELDMIICATLQGEYIMPSLACLVQESIGSQCTAFDINAACSGFLYALDVAKSYFDTKKVKKVLIVCADQLSKFIDWNDRSTCVLFGDGAGAVVLSEGEGILSISLKSKARSDCLNIRADIPQGPFSGTEDNSRRSYFSMNGQEVYKFAVSTVSIDSQRAVQEAGICLDDVDYFLLHQANGRIIEAARSRLGQPESKFPVNFATMGNTSSASIPMLIDELNTNNRLKTGDILLLSAFGAGLTSGVCIIKWGQ